MTSMQIAELIDKLHHHVIRDIRDEVENLEAAGISTETKFGLSERQDSTGRTIPYYNLTREGILQLAARYDAVTRAKLIEMAMRGEQPRKVMSQIELIAGVAVEMAKQEQLIREQAVQIETIQHNMQDMRDVISLDPTGWREDCAKLVNKIAIKAGGAEHIKDVWSEIHRLVDKRLGANLSIRVTNIKKRMALEGASKSKINAINALDAISENKRLIEGTVAIIKQLAIKNGVGGS